MNGFIIKFMLLTQDRQLNIKAHLYNDPWTIVFIKIIYKHHFHLVSDNLDWCGMVNGVIDGSLCKNMVSKACEWSQKGW